MKVRKRNKKYEPFDKAKIESSIKKAADAVDETIPNFMIMRIATQIENELQPNNIIPVDTIGKLIEDKLMKTNYKDTTKSYITYHYNRQKEYFYESEIIKTFKKKLAGKNTDNNNANMDERSFSGRQYEAAKVFYKDDALNNMPKLFRDNHNNNRVYIHDLDSYSAGEHNCLSLDVDDLLQRGVAIKQTDLRGSRSVNTAFQVIAVLFQIQSLVQFGGVATTHIDWTLVPYVRYSLIKHLADILAYELDKDEDVIKNKIYNKLLKVNKIKYTEADKKDKIDELVHDYMLDFITQLTNITKDILNQDDVTKPITRALRRTKRETEQGAEGFIHNCNSLQSRSGMQLPFTSINYGTCTLPEGQMIIDAIITKELDGTGPLHKTPIFPCCIFQWEKSINGYPNTPNYDLFRKALLCTSKRLYPNYANVNWTVDVNNIKKDIDNKKEVITKYETNEDLINWIKTNPKEAIKYRLIVKNNKVCIDEDVFLPFEIMSTMGCRTYNGYDANFDFNYVLKYIIKNKDNPKTYLYSANQKDGRGNIAPATVILPTIAMETKGDLGNKNIDDFLKRLEKAIEECKDELVERFTFIASQLPTSATFMYFNNTMKGYIPEEGIISALKHGTLAIGNLGCAECLQILIGKDHTTPEGMELAKQIYSLFNRKCAEYKEATYNILGQNIHLNTGAYNTPAESLCHTALNKFVEKYGVIPNVSDKEFFTNSMHIPVWKDVTPFEKIDLESQLTGYSNAGCITYCELDSTASHNIDALEKLVVYGMEHNIPYLALNLPNDTCMNCGWTGEINDKCPKCNSTDIKRLRRVTGYLTNDYLTTFNKGKVDEVHHRVKHKGIYKEGL